MGAETDEEIAEMMDRITNGNSEISHRHRCDLDIEAITLPDGRTFSEEAADQKVI